MDIDQVAADLAEAARVDVSRLQALWQKVDQGERSRVLHRVAQLLCGDPTSVTAAIFAAFAGDKHRALRLEMGLLLARRDNIGRADLDELVEELINRPRLQQLCSVFRVAADGAGQMAETVAEALAFDRELDHQPELAQLVAGLAADNPTMHWQEIRGLAELLATGAAQ